MSDLTEQIEQAVDEPAAAAQDGRSATARSIPDLIAADKYLAAKEAAKSGMNGLVFNALKPPSALG